ncbi:MAG: DUF4760 domain-containing protein [Anaerolineales bacterium]|jgi:hypothetical protein
MKTLEYGIKTIGVFFIVTLVVFLIWIFSIFFISRIFDLLALSDNLYVAIEALSTALAVATVFGAGYFAIQELSESSKTRYMEIADKLFNELNSEENIKARKTVYQLSPFNPDISLSPHQRESIKKVLNSLDRVAFLTQKGWIPDEIIMPWLHPMIAKSWDKLEPYVNYQRNLRGESYYYEHASELAQRCFAWRQKNRIQNQVNYVNDEISI